MSAASILVRARARLSDPRRRTTGAFARDRHGYRVLPETAQAVCWCVLGAIDAEGLIFHEQDREMETAIESLVAAAGIAPGESRTSVFDRMSHPDLMSAFDKAIASLQGASSRCV